MPHWQAPPDALAALAADDAGDIGGFDLDSPRCQEWQRRALAEQQAALARDRKADEAEVSAE